MNISAIALGGLQQAQADLERVSKQVANPKSHVDSVSLSSEAVAMISAKNQFEANISLLKTADEMEKNALAVLPTKTPSS